MEDLQRSETQNKRRRYEPGSYSACLSRTLVRFNLEEYSPRYVMGECLFVSIAFNVSQALKLVSPQACALKPSDVRLEIAAIYEDQRNHAFLDDWITDSLKLARPDGSVSDMNDIVLAERAKMMRYRAENGHEPTEDKWEWGTGLSYTHDKKSDSLKSVDSIFFFLNFDLFLPLTDVDIQFFFCC